VHDKVMVRSTLRIGRCRRGAAHDKHSLGGVLRGNLAGCEERFRRQHVQFNAHAVNSHGLCDVSACRNRSAHAGNDESRFQKPDQMSLHDKLPSFWGGRMFPQNDRSGRRLVAIPEI
jgi:hypothetical protein